MEIKTGSRGMRFLASSTVLLALLTGCSGDGSKTSPVGLPTPELGKIAAFDLGALSKEYDLNKTVVVTWTLVTTDQAGNVYMMDRSLQHPDVLKMTPQGVVSRYAQPVFVKTPTAMVVRSDGSMVFSDSTTSADYFRVISRDGTETELRISPNYKDARPIGERPDGSLIITEGGTIWSLKDGKATDLYHQSKDIYESAVVDPSGTIYTVPENLGDIIAIPVGKQPYHLNESGTVPNSTTPIASLAPGEMTPASTGGFYALADDKAITETFVLYVQGTKTTVLAKTSLNQTCVPGKQYPALTNTCEAQAYLVQSGDLLLFLGNLTTHNDSPAEPALALKAVS